MPYIDASKRYFFSPFLSLGYFFSISRLHLFNGYVVFLLVNLKQPINGVYYIKLNPKPDYIKY